MTGLELWRWLDCPHSNRSFPQTDSTTKVSHQVCLDCGAERNYEFGMAPGPWRKDWNDADGSLSPRARHRLAWFAIVFGLLALASVIEYVVTYVQHWP